MQVVKKCLGPDLLMTFHERVSQYFMDSVSKPGCVQPSSRILLPVVISWCSVILVEGIVMATSGGTAIGGDVTTLMDVEAMLDGARGV